MSPMEEYFERIEEWIYGGSLARAIGRGSLVFLPIIALGTWILSRMFG